MELEEIIKAWNEQADDWNKWDSLDSDEKVEFAMKCMMALTDSSTSNPSEERDQMTSLADSIAKEQSRCRGLLKKYTKIGLIGNLGYTMIETILRDVDKAVMEGNTVEMIRLKRLMEELE